MSKENGIKDDKNQSMDDILSSIRKILKEDVDEDKHMAKDGVIELTHCITEDGSIKDLSHDLNNAQHLNHSTQPAAGKLPNEQNNPVNLAPSPLLEQVGSDLTAQPNTGTTPTELPPVAPYREESLKNIPQDLLNLKKNTDTALTPPPDLRDTTDLNNRGSLEEQISSKINQMLKESLEPHAVLSGGENLDQEQNTLINNEIAKHFGLSTPKAVEKPLPNQEIQNIFPSTKLSQEDRQNLEKLNQMSTSAPSIPLPHSPIPPVNNGQSTQAIPEKEEAPLGQGPSNTQPVSQPVSQPVPQHKNSTTQVTQVTQPQVPDHTPPPVLHTPPSNFTDASQNFIQGSTLIDAQNRADLLKSIYTLKSLKQTLKPQEKEQKPHSESKGTHKPFDEVIIDLVENQVSTLMQATDFKALTQQVLTNLFAQAHMQNLIASQLKAWISQNLPAIVEKIIQQEIKGLLQNLV